MKHLNPLQNQKSGFLSISALFFVALFLSVSPIFAQTRSDREPEPQIEMVSPNLLISEVYGGGGNAGASFNDDFIELYNNSDVAVPLNGYAIQYASAAGTTFQTVALPNVTLAPRTFFLIQITTTGINGAALPTPDFTTTDFGNTGIAEGAGKVALTSTTTPLTVPCPASQTSNVVDKVGYGTTSAVCNETANAPSPTQTTSVRRRFVGITMTDTDNNSADFVLGAPSPRNSPTAASAAVTGRVTTFEGRGIYRATVTITDNAGNVRMAMTNPFGFYQFLEVPSGETYVFTVRAKRYQFSQPQQVLFVSGDTDLVNFVANP